jgi:4-hydroxy-tetrahydrodipicolinate synthase
MSNDILHGVIIPVITPLDDNEAVDEGAFRAQIDRLINAGVHGLFIGGSAGEGPVLREQEWQRMIEIASNATAGRVPLLGGVIETSLSRGLEKLKRLQQLDYQYFVVTPTFYLANSGASEHMRLFEACWRERGDMEMIAYNIPGCVGSSISVDTFIELAEKGWIRHCKESSGDTELLAQLIPRGNAVGLRTLVGDERLIPLGLFAGGHGFIPVCGNAVPEVCVDLYNATIAGDGKLAAQHHAKLIEARHAMIIEGTCWLSGIKYAVSKQGIGNGRISPPLDPPSIRQKELIDKILGL